ncbi:MAG: calcineurin-like phosphoesterase family protein [Ignavibacteriae bacterium]|nr:calcineurin-like phosphoesterase family protein [Ignavibacteriota bacterium]
MSNRRAFLKHAGLTAASLLIAESIIARPYNPIFRIKPLGNPVRVRGSVKSRGKGLANVTVSDGVSVAQTKSDGTFDFISDSRQPFVFLSLPSGYTIPTNPTGTALFYQLLKANSGEATAEFILDPLPTPDTKHAFLQLADPQTLDAADVARFHAETVPDVQATAKRMSDTPLFGVGCGDLMFDRLEFFPDYEKAVKWMGIPCFQVVGNHDVEVDQKTDEGSIRTFSRYFGPTYYSFNRGDIHYVVLDDIFWFGGYIGYVHQQQLDWLKADLALVEKGKTVVTFIHIPAYNLQFKREGQRNAPNSVVVTNRELLYRLLEPYKSYIITGHMHESEYLKDGGSEIHVTGAVCGAWWTGPICHDGTPNGYSVYEASGSELSWQYKSTGLDVNHQLRLYTPKSELNPTDELIANVWTADEHWTVAWYENGMKKGMMTRRNGKDPLSVKLHSGDTMPKKHSWVEPGATDHLFFTKLSQDVKEIVVEATDRWGRVYKEKVSL